MTDFYHKKVVPFENFMNISLSYQDIDILLKSLELFCYNIKNVYLVKEDNYAIKEKLYRISILYNLILSSYTLHIDNELKNNDKSRKVYKMKNKNNKLTEIGGMRVVS